MAKQAQVLALYNAHYFEHILDYMHVNNFELFIDGTDTLWHKEDVKDMLAQFIIKEFANIHKEGLT